jgi:general secretion pathway protein J
MRHAAPIPRASVAGFSLVEALVTMVLVGLILGGLSTVTAQWLPTWNRGFDRVQRSDLVGLALDRVAGDLSAAEFVRANRDAKNVLFEGGELAVTLVRSALGPNSTGLEVVRIGETTDRQGTALVRWRAPFVPLAPPASPSQIALANPVVLLRAPYRLTFAYFGGKGGWQSSWEGSGELPRAVRLTVRDALSQRTLLVSTATMVHVNMAPPEPDQPDSPTAPAGANGAQAGAQAQPGQ